MSEVKLSEKFGELMNNENADDVEGFIQDNYDAILSALRLAESSPSVAETVEREREACAKLAESADLLFLHYPKDKPVPIDAESMMALVAAAIRNRKE
jgi:hypothetical protein